MKWREYPTAAERNRDKSPGGPAGGIERTGRKWSAGPTIGTTWAIPDDHPRRMSLVHRSAIGPDWSAADQDQMLAMRRAGT
jgi:long-subunit fatty acid transport protein